MNKRLFFFFLTEVFFSFLLISCTDDVSQPTPSSRLVILYYPEHNQILPDTPITFKWGTTGSSADSFKIEIAQDSMFSTGVFTGGTLQEQYKVNPIGDTNYFYWKVTGFWKNLNDSDISIVKKFKQR